MYPSATDDRIGAMSQRPGVFTAGVLQEEEDHRQRGERIRNSTPTPPEVPSQKNRLTSGSQPWTAKTTSTTSAIRVWKSEPAAGAPERARVRPKNAGRTRSRPSANA